MNNRTKPISIKSGIEACFNSEKPFDNIKLLFLQQHLQYIYYKQTKNFFYVVRVLFSLITSFRSIIFLVYHIWM